MAGRLCLPRLRQVPCGRAAKPATFVRMPRLWPANLNHRRHGDASLQIAADDMVLGRASHDNAFERHVGVTTAGAAWRDLQNRLAADAKTPALDGRSESQPLEGVVEVDQAEIA